MNQIELLAPAGDEECLRSALDYGCDAVYLAGKSFGMRAGAKNFDMDGLDRAVRLAHERGVKVHLTCNTIPLNSEIEQFPKYIAAAQECGVDAAIACDLGVISMIKEYAPKMELHISTQTGVVNYQTAIELYKMGAKRVVLAREVGLEDIREIHRRIPADMEIETFVHGAMCISYSGRCLLSNYMAGRDANMGACAHPCRWKYRLVEEKRPGEYMPVFENERGTYIYNSKDLCMIEYIPELIESGISSLKIEGRVKNELYIATVVGAYRKAIDAYYSDKENYRLDPYLLEELTKISYRGYTTGFFFGKPKGTEQIYDRSTYIQEYKTEGVVKSYDPETKTAVIEQRNRFFSGDEVEIITPGKESVCVKLGTLYNDEGAEISCAPHPQMSVTTTIDADINEYSIIRKREEK